MPNYQPYSLAMLWMESFCFYCSVRLGVIVTAIYSLLQSIVYAVVLIIFGSPVFKTTRQFIERDEQYSQDPFLRRILDGLTERTETYMIGFHTLLAVHIVTCVLAVYGAYKLKRFYLIPYMISQFVIFVGWLGQHVVTMIIMKKVVNLGILIGFVLLGGFYILFVGYSWAGAVGLYQIIVLVNSEKYKALYGQDPMTPRERKDVLLGHGTIENVRIFLTPKNNEIAVLKGLLASNQQKRADNKVISVLPVEQAKTRDDTDLITFSNYWLWNELVGDRKRFK